MNTPLYLNNFIIHKDIAQKLSAFNEYVPHMLFYGPTSSGKKTLIYAMINNIHNNAYPIQKYRNIKFDDITINGNLIPINYIQTPYHFEFNLSEFGLCDTDVIISYIQKIIEYKTINNSFHIIILRHIDRLSTDTQKTILSLMDKYISTTRFIFIANNIQPIYSCLKSRLLSIRVPTPNKINIYNYIQYSYPSLSNKQIDKIIECSNYNLYNLCNLLPSIKQCIDANPNTILTENKLDEILKTPNIKSIIETLIPHIKEHNITSIKTIRTILYDLLLSNIQIKDVFSNIVAYIMKCDNIPLSSRQLFLQDINNIEVGIVNIEYNIIIIEFLIFKVKKLFLQHNV
jgi:DNA polymerase III delta prime subunit